MLVTRKSKLQLKAQSIIFTFLFLAVLGLIAFLSLRYNYQADWTAGNRNTLSDPSQKLLVTIEGPISITAFTRDMNETLRDQIRQQIGRYQRVKPDISLEFVNPDLEPDRVRRLGVSVEGELIIEYRGKTENLRSVREVDITNALQRLARSQERWIVFVEGHGERNPRGQANHDLGSFGSEMERKGFKVQTIQLAATQAVPDNTAALVIAGSQVDWLPIEVRLVNEYIAAGGNLLWLHDPGSLYGLESVAETLGLKFLAGTIVDATSQLFGINDPTMVLVSDYPFGPLTSDFGFATLYPRATGIDITATADWQTKPFLQTLPRSWQESGPLEGEIVFDAENGDVDGPLTIGLYLSRQITTGESSEDESAREQRIVVTGDGDFLANAYLGNGGNLDLGLNIVNWLSHDDTQIAINARSAPDLSLTLPGMTSLMIAITFLIVIPLGLIGSGIGIWLVRRRR